MKFYPAKIFIALMLLTTVSCSEYNKLLKSGSNKQKYDKALEYFNAGKYSRSLTLFKDIEHIFSQSDQADTVAFYTSLCSYKMGDFETSSQQFDEFRRRFGRSPFLEESEYYFAKGFYYLSPKPENDQSFTFQAMQAISEYLDRYPKSQKRDELLENMIELRQKLYDKAFLNAKLYYDVGYYNSAVTALRNAILKYPESNHREELAYLIVSAQCLYARNSVPALQRQRYLDTQNAYYSFIDEYPESKYRKEADKMQDEAKKFLEKYKEKPDGTEAEDSEEVTESAPSLNFSDQTGTTAKRGKAERKEKKEAKAAVEKEHKPAKESKAAREPKPKKEKSEKSNKSDNSETSKGTEEK